MYPERESPFTFIIRLWREKNNGAYTWRGAVECVQSGERAYFQTLGHLDDLLARMMDIERVENEKTGPLQSETR